MKKILPFILLIAFVFSGCGAKINDNNIVQAKIMVKAADAYLEGELTSAAAYNKVEEATSNIDESDDTTEYASLTFSISASGLSISLLTEDAKGVKERRNEIAKMAGIK